MDEQRDVGIGEEVEGLFGRRVGSHDDGGARGEMGGGCWRECTGGQVGVVHEGDMRHVVGACCEMELCWSALADDDQISCGWRSVSSTNRALRRQVTTSLGRLSETMGSHEAAVAVVAVVGISLMVLWLGWWLLVLLLLPILGRFSNVGRRYL